MWICGINRKSRRTEISKEKGLKLSEPYKQQSGRREREKRRQSIIGCVIKVPESRC